MSTLLYHETQRFPGIMEIILLTGILFFMVYRLFRAKKKVSKILLWIFIPFYSLIAGSAVFMRLDTLYYSDRVEYQFICLFSGKYDVTAVAEIDSVKIITYNFSHLDLGTNGVAYGKMYDSPPNKALLFSLKNGQYLMLATNHADTLLARLSNYYPFH